MFKFLAKTSVAAMLSAVPPAVWYCAISIGLVLMGGWINGLRWENKYAKHLAIDAQAIEIAKSRQLSDNHTAAIQYVEVAGKTKTVVIERIKEVKVYEQNNKNNESRVCAAGDTFGSDYERLYNNEAATIPNATN